MPRTRDLQHDQEIFIQILTVLRVRRGVDFTYEYCQSRIKDTYIRLEGQYNIKTEGDLDQEVYADPDRIEQVVTNFINNVIKYAPESKEILVSIAKEQSMVKVSVSDKGPGVQTDQLV